MDEVPRHWLSIDLETSGTDPEKHSILSIGMEHIRSGEKFYQEIRWNNVTIAPEAMRVNGFDAKQLDGDGEFRGYIGEVDAEARQWVDDLKAEHGIKGGIWTVGVNQLGFDKPFIEQEMPQLDSRLSYRGVNLTSVWAAIGLAKGIPFRDVKYYYYSEVAPNERKHNAMADAEQVATIVRHMCENLDVSGIFVGQEEE